MIHHATQVRNRKLSIILFPFLAIYLYCCVDAKQVGAWLKRKKSAEEDVWWNAGER